VRVTLPTFRTRVAPSSGRLCPFRSRCDVSHRLLLLPLLVVVACKKDEPDRDPGDPDALLCYAMGIGPTVNELHLYSFDPEAASSRMHARLEGIVLKNSAFQVSNLVVHGADRMVFNAKNGTDHFWYEADLAASKIRTARTSEGPALAASDLRELIVYEEGRLERYPDFDALDAGTPTSSI